MQFDFSLQSVRRFIEGDDWRLLEKTDSLLGVALICLGAAAPALGSALAGPAGAVAGVSLGAAGIQAIAVKNELISRGKEVFQVVTRGRGDGYLDRERRTHAAFGLICFTSFFEAIDHSLPKETRDRIQLTLAEKSQLIRKVFGDDSAVATVDADRLPAISLFADGVRIPQPPPLSYDFREELRRSYEEMQGRFIAFLQKLSIWDDLDKEPTVPKALHSLARTAMSCFDGQYLELAVAYPAFATWSGLQAHVTTQKALHAISDKVARSSATSAQALSQIDVGLRGLRDLTEALPELFAAKEAKDIVEGLRSHYSYIVNRPMLEYGEQTEGVIEGLTFPSVKDIYVPQSYKVVRYSAESQAPLGDPGFWDSLKEHQDLGQFILRFLMSPHGVRYPLIVLGEPGSGKSLLTKILAELLLSRNFLSLLVELRMVDPEATVSSQIVQEITRVTHREIRGWASFADQFTDCPPTAILDGFDELLQASGTTQAHYLRHVAEFQDEELSRGHPLRVIVTSRPALIDKARIPNGSIVVRLSEFADRQTKRWIAIWNSANKQYFIERGLKRFALTQRSGKENANLARRHQPQTPLLLRLLRPRAPSRFTGSSA